MKRILSLLIILLLTFLTCGCAPVMAQKDKDGVQLPPGTLNAAEVTALFSGRTVESVLDSNGRTSLTYYNPNGELNQLQKGIKRNGVWRVRDDGRMCLNFAGEKEKCRIIVKEGAVYSKYIVKKNGQHERIITYKSFRNGNLVE
jgi:hypothetical protein